MRSRLAFVILVLFAACTDRSTPAVVVAGPPPADADAIGKTGRIPGGRRSIPDDTATGDTASFMDRLDDMMMGGITQVSIPPDAYSHQADGVHPDVACSQVWWNGSYCWVAYTPYAGSNQEWENPSFLTMIDDDHWKLPMGVINPVVPYPGAGSYNSDPDHAFDPGTGRLVTFYREVSDGFNQIYAISTADGFHWTTPKLAFQVANHDAVSPAVVVDADRSARMWYVQSGIGCSAPSTRIRLRTAHPPSGQSFEDATWSPPDDVTITQPGFAIWHMDVLKLPGFAGYVAVMADHAANTDCASDDIWIATSPDGITWLTYPVPIFWRASTGATRLGVRSWYRAAIRYDAESGVLHIWPSALMNDEHWSIFHTSVNYMMLMRAMRAATAADQPTAQLGMRSVVPPALRNHMP